MKQKIIKTIIALMTSIFIMTACDSEEPSSDTENITYKIGDKGPAGGWVFYDKGSYSDGWRYLECAPYEEESAIWGKNLEEDEEPLYISSRDIGDGQENTLAIIANDSSSDKAADKSAGFSINNNGKTYDDWFLPSYDELKLMFTNLKDKGIGNFSNSLYWSSTEYNSPKALACDFETGNKESRYKEIIFSFRPARAF